MNVLIVTKIFQAVRTNSKGFFLASTVEYVIIVATKVRNLTTYSPTAASFSIVTTLNTCICSICVDTFCIEAVFTAPNASPNTCWFALLQYAWTIHIICQCSPTVDITHDGRTSTAHMRCIKITYNNVNMTIVLRLRSWSWCWFYLWFWSWSWCWFYLRFWSWSWLWFHLWLRSRSWCWFNFWFWSWSWLWFYFWLRSWFRLWLRLRFWSRFYLWFRSRSWFIFTIHVFTLTIFICLPCNIAFFSMTRSDNCKTTRFRTIRCNSYCALKISFTIYIVMIIHLMCQVI